MQPIGMQARAPHPCATFSRSRRSGSRWRSASCRYCQPLATHPDSPAGSCRLAVPAASQPSAVLPPLLRDRPRLRFGSGGTFGAGLSHALIAVEFRETCSATSRPTVRQINASCNRSGSPPTASSSNARGIVASLGTLPRNGQPHSLRSVTSIRSRSTNPRVVGTSHTALARNERQQDPARPRPCCRAPKLTNAATTCRLDTTPAS